jgi:DNA invertase Pin-like site-specific DNA recombinase
MDSIGYARVSRPHQDLDGQEKRVTSLALRHGYYEPGILGEVAHRFSPIEDRPNGSELIRCLHTTRHPLCLESVDRIGGTEQVIRFAKDHVRETGHRFYISKQSNCAVQSNKKTLLFIICRVL